MCGSVGRKSFFGVSDETHKSVTGMNLRVQEGPHGSVRGRAVYVVCPYGIDERRTDGIVYNRGTNVRPAAEAAT